MPQFTAKFDACWQIMQADQFAVTGAQREFYPESAQLLAADRYDSKVVILSAGLSAESLNIAPLGVSAPAMLMMLCTDYPVDIRTNSVSDTVFLSGVQLWFMTGFVSNLFLTTGSSDTTVLLKVAGGSNAVLQHTFPLP